MIRGQDAIGAASGIDHEYEGQAREVATRPRAGIREREGPAGGDRAVALTAGAIHREICRRLADRGYPWD